MINNTCCYEKEKTKELFLFFLVVSCREMTGNILNMVVVLLLDHTELLSKCPTSKTNKKTQEAICWLEETTSRGNS
jgi:hypothetical protein